MLENFSHLVGPLLTGISALIVIAIIAYAIVHNSLTRQEDREQAKLEERLKNMKRRN